MDIDYSEKATRDLAILVLIPS
ncbi:hypothetical protein TIFTF001_055820 [Ficus carica]|uniref:Uncharacterized protein n=1 Tax=Ficus carica TaxID=3494 RepID=A0AA88EGJ6_FICCA|nr:hypothetical protein TIFTF001_055819 [Ficus carica]GMN74559.1 hypothetical protein TIFTF001_055820 [Ficus carica]